MLTRLPEIDLDEVDFAAPLDLPTGPVVGVSRRVLPESAAPLLERLAFTFAPGGPGRAWADLEPRPVEVSAVPARVLLEVLAVTEHLPVADALVVESLAYSMLLGAGDFRAWRDRTPARPVPEKAEPVRLERDGDRLTVTLDVPERHNAFGRAVRDGLLAALDVVRLDATVREVRLVGAGPSFCSGGDLDEFGTARDPALAHATRLDASAGRAVHGLRARMRPVLHGACIGAGIEVPAFADRVLAREGAWFCLPELAFGLIPGAGGTVSLPRRIGRWRTACLALTGARLDLDTALAWGLVDGRA